MSNSLTSIKSKDLKILSLGYSVQFVAKSDFGKSALLGRKTLKRKIILKLPGCGKTKCFTPTLVALHYLSFVSQHFFLIRATTLSSSLH